MEEDSQDLSSDDAVEQVISNLENDDRYRRWELRVALDKMHDHASTEGLSTSNIRRLVDALTLSKSLNNAGRFDVIRSLYPATRVPSDVIYVIVGSLGLGIRKPSLPIQQALVEWLIMVYDYLKTPSALSQCYDVLFNLLDIMGLRPELCHLLALITRRKHVQPLRIEVLNDLQRKVGDEPALHRLLHVYDRYHPGMMIPRSTKKSTQDFLHPNPGWGTQLKRIQEQAKRRSESQGDLDDAFGATIPSTSIQSTSEPASLETSQIQDQLYNFVNSLSHPLLRDLTIFDLASNDIQNRAILMPEETALKLDELLSPIFEQHLEKLERGLKENNALSVLLDRVFSSYTKHTKTLPISVVTFFATYFPLWNGEKNQETILALLSHLPIHPFDDLQMTLLTPLETALRRTTTASEPTPTVLLEFYTHLLATWTGHLLSLATGPTPVQTGSLSAFVDHTALLCLTLLTTTPNSCHLILTFYTNLLPLLQPPLSLPIPPSTPLTIHLLLFSSPTLSTLSQTCSILASFKKAFETTASTSTTTSTSQETPPPGRQPRPQSHVDALNATLIDTCNNLFRSRAFNRTDLHALGCLLPPSTTTALAEYTSGLDPPQPLTALFSLSHHPALAALSIAAFREMEDAAAEADEEAVVMRHEGPITQKSLAQLARDGGVKVDWRAYRVAVLKWLEGMGVGGLRELGEATMKGLMNGQDGVKARDGT